MYYVLLVLSFTTHFGDCDVCFKCEDICFPEEDPFNKTIKFEVKLGQIDDKQTALSIMPENGRALNVYRKKETLEYCFNLYCICVCCYRDCSFRTKPVEEVDSQIYLIEQASLKRIETVVQDVDEVPSVSEKDVDEVPSVSEKDVDEVPSESEKDVDEVPSVSEKDVDEVPSVSEKDVDEVPSVSEKDVDEVPSVSEKDVDEIPSVPETTQQDVDEFTLFEKEEVSKESTGLYFQRQRCDILYKTQVVLSSVLKQTINILEECWTPGMEDECFFQANIMLLNRFVDVCNQMVLIFGQSAKRTSICHESIQMKGFALNALKESNPFPIQQQIEIAFRDYIKKLYFNVQAEISKYCIFSW